MRRTVVFTFTALVIFSGLAGATAPGVDRTLAAGNERPLADAGLDQDVSRGATVLLDASGSRDPDGSIVDFEWTITTPDGNTVAPACPSCARTRFRPTQTGVYEVTVSVTDDDGATATDTLYVNVSPGTPPSIRVDGPGSVAAGTSATVTATIDPGAAPLSTVVWRVDGRRVATHAVGPDATADSYRLRLSSAGRHRITATVRDADGQSDAATHVVTVTASGDGGGDGDGRDGNGRDGNGRDDTGSDGGGQDGDGRDDHRGGDGRDGGSSSDGSPDSKPGVVAELAANRTTVTAGDTVAFDASGSTASHGRIVGYEWAVGDASVAGNQRTTHTFESPGTYLVTVGVTARNGSNGTRERDTASVAITVRDPGPGGGDGRNSRQNYTISLTGPERIVRTNYPDRAPDGSGYWTMDPAHPGYTITLENQLSDDDASSPTFDSTTWYVESGTGRRLATYHGGNHKQIDMSQFSTRSKVFLRVEAIQNGTVVSRIMEITLCTKWDGTDSPVLCGETDLPNLGVVIRGPKQTLPQNSVNFEADFQNKEYYSIQNSDWRISSLGTQSSGFHLSHTFPKPDRGQNTYRIHFETTGIFKDGLFEYIDNGKQNTVDDYHLITVKNTTNNESSREKGEQQESEDTADDDLQSGCPSGEVYIRLIGCLDPIGSGDVGDAIRIGGDFERENDRSQNDTHNCPTGRRWSELLDRCTIKIPDEIQF